MERISSLEIVDKAKEWVEWCIIHYMTKEYPSNKKKSNKKNPIFKKRDKVTLHQNIYFKDKVEV